MHELGMCQGLVEAVERRAGGRRVARVGVRAGTLLRVAPAALEQSFQLVAAGGVADGAGVELFVVPLQGRCRDCGGAFSSDDPTPACPACGSLATDAEGGEELVLEWVAYRGEPSGAAALRGAARDDRLEGGS
ncbi:hydrogenase maturation nickel metallochaperone HypA [soil metagenome]